MTTLEYVTDQTTGIAYVRQQGAGLTSLRMKGHGSVTYRCHTCGELIPKHWETFFFDPLDGWASYILPSVLTPSMTTHHDWHMSSTQED
jgi:hypothetical protein